MKATNICKATSDATLIITVGELLHHVPAMILNKEDKLAKGEGGGDAYMQNVGYYALFWANASEQAVWTHCVCPSILIEQAGHEVSLNETLFIL